MRRSITYWPSGLNGVKSLPLQSNSTLMKKLFLAVLLAVVFFAFASWSAVKNDTIAIGEQPQIAMDTRGMVRVVFGQKDKIFCATSKDKGATFSQPVLVAEIPKMHLGMSRGPQLATSANYSIITAQDQSGTIHWYRLDHSSGEWKSMGAINDLKGSAPEGLMGVSADKKDNFYAVWLDTRAGGGNNIFFSSLSNNSTTWSKNRLVYQSPDKLVCGCCKPNIAVNGAEVAIMFRNWLNGSRDLYVLKSMNGGATFAAAQKLGLDTWKLNACPMDGGGIIVDGSAIRTTWQRKGEVFYAEPGKPEVLIGKGRNSSIAGDGVNAVITFHNNDTVKMIQLKNKRETAIGTGSYLKSLVLPGNKTLCVWEDDKKIKFRRI
ncbi:MAG: hypothetical protein JWR02_1176 [Mucilaginibacter sp.]|nr:hypothetical protein [Mucilaginibacter sp.]